MDGPAQWSCHWGKLGVQRAAVPPIANLFGDFGGHSLAFIRLSSFLALAFLMEAKVQGYFVLRIG